MIACEDWNLGKTVNDNWTAGEACRVYCPQPGDELLVLASDADDNVPIGGKLINVAASGKFINTTGTPDSEPFIALESTGTITVDQHLLVVATGN